MKTLYTLLLSAVISSAFAQTGSIQGIVKTSDGQPAPYVNVNLKGENKGTVTEVDGSYIIKNVKPGTYTVVTSFVGFAPQEQDVEVTANETAQLNFDLQESAQQLSEVEVTGKQSLNEQSPTIGKIKINPMDLPQSVMVIDRAILDNQQALNVGDVLMNANGVYVMGTSGGTQQELAGRGFSFGSNNTFKNGIRFNNAVMPELSGVERVEILKGSAAMLFGQVGAGGIINLVTKKPKFQNGGGLSFRAGSYGFVKPSLDFYGAINGSDRVAYRINSSYENAHSFRDNVSAERIYFNPSFLIKVGKKMDIIVEGDFLKDNRTLDFGTAAIDYKIVDISRNTYLNTSWAYYEAQQKTATATVNYQLSTAWQLSLVGSYQGYAQDQYGTSRPNANSNFVKPDGTWIRTLQGSVVDQEYYIAQLNLTGKFKTGFLEHALLFGADIDRYENTTRSMGYVDDKGKYLAYDTINVFDERSFKGRQDIPARKLITTASSPLNRSGVYFQDLVTITEKFKALIGLRYSYVDTRGKTFNTITNKVTANTANYPQAFSPRIGLIYQPTKSISIFTSYSNSFDVNVGVDSLERPYLPPSYINQYEIGVKNELFNGVMSVNVTAYRIDNSNSFLSVSTVDPTYKGSSQAKISAGAIRSQGVELDLMSKSFHGFSLIAGYSYNDTRYVQSLVYIKNSRLRYNPKHTANLSVEYGVKGFSVGFTSHYVGERVAGRSTRTNIKDDKYKLIAVPNYFLFDLRAGYNWNNISVQGKISNLLNELSYNVHDDNSVNPIAPRQFSATVSYKF